MCLKCQGSGVDMDRSTARPGVLMVLCPTCQGAGAITDQGQQQPYRAIFLVGTRFIVRITIPRLVGGFVEMDVDWSPRMPPAHGKGRLRPTERRDYEAGRDAAMRQHNAQMGGREFTLVAAGDRH
jgi:hypothetical protein